MAGIVGMLWPQTLEQPSPQPCFVEVAMILTMAATPDTGTLILLVTRPDLRSSGSAGDARDPG